MDSTIKHGNVLADYFRVEAQRIAHLIDAEILGDVFGWHSEALLAPPPLAIWNPWGDVVPPQKEAPERESGYPSSEWQHAPATFEPNLTRSR